MKSRADFSEVGSPTIRMDFPEAGSTTLFKRVNFPKVGSTTNMIDKSKLPRHIAIIMDGNGRWAKKRGLPKSFGHRQGVKTVEKIIKACGELGVKILTLYTFSLDNWQRPKQEVDVLMKLLDNFFKTRIGEFNKNNIKLITIGEKKKLPPSIQKKIAAAIETTKKNTGLILNLALSYSGRAEIVNAARRIAGEVKKNKCSLSKIDEQLFSQYLYTANLPDPDLLIRTSGKMRISNFLLWQISYTELYISPKLWPDFTKKDLIDAISDFQTRERRFGK